MSFNWWEDSIIILLGFHPSYMLLNVLALCNAFCGEVLVLLMLHLIQLGLLVEDSRIVHYQARYIQRFWVVLGSWREFIRVDCLVNLREWRLRIPQCWRMVWTPSCWLLLCLHHQFSHSLCALRNLLPTSFRGIFIESDRLFPLIKGAILSCDSVKLHLAFFWVGVCQYSPAFLALLVLLVQLFVMGYFQCPLLVY